MNNVEQSTIYQAHPGNGSNTRQDDRGHNNSNEESRTGSQPQVESNANRGSSQSTAESSTARENGGKAQGAGTSSTGQPDGDTKNAGLSEAAASRSWADMAADERPDAVNGVRQTGPKVSSPARDAANSLQPGLRHSPVPRDVRRNDSNRRNGTAQVGVGGRGLPVDARLRQSALLGDVDGAERGDAHKLQASVGRGAVSLGPHQPQAGGGRGRRPKNRSPGDGDAAMLSGQSRPEIDLGAIEKSSREAQSSVANLLGDLHVDPEGKYTPRSRDRAEALVNGLRENNGQLTPRSKRRAGEIVVELKGDKKAALLKEGRCFKCGQKGHKQDECRIMDSSSGGSGTSSSSSSDSESSESSESSSGDPNDLNKKLHDQEDAVIGDFEDVDTFKFPWVNTFGKTFVFVEKVMILASAVGYVVTGAASALTGNVVDASDMFGETGDLIKPSDIDSGVRLLPETPVVASVSQLATTLKNALSFAGDIAIKMHRGGYVRKLSWERALLTLVLVPLTASALFTIHEYVFRPRVRYTFLRRLPPKYNSHRDMRHTSQKVRKAFYQDQQLQEYLVYDCPYGIHGYMWAMMHDSFYRTVTISGELFVAICDPRNSLDTLEPSKMYSAMQWRAAMEDRIYTNRYDMANGDVINNTARMAYHWVMSKRRRNERTF